MAYRGREKIAKSAKKLQEIEILTIRVDLIGLTKLLKLNELCILGHFFDDHLCFFDDLLGGVSALIL
ncbi:hypothetical protein BS333_18895 [Vibrio azureus]|nr:hypothetical protein BS333_18895 [Vibrio azureus]